MSPVAIVWLVVGLGGLLLGVIFTVAMVRHGVLLGRAVARVAREAAETAAPSGSGDPDR